MASHVADGTAEHPDAVFFELQMSFATLLSVEGDALVFRTWRPGRGVRLTRRN
jgi:hypothetical protein